MEIIVDQETFLDGVQRIAALTDRKNAALVGSQVLLDAQGETVTLYASDTQTGGRFELPAKVLAPGKTTVPGKTLFNLIRQLPPGDQTITRDASGLTRIERERIQNSLKGINPDEFNVFPEITAEYSFLVPLGAFLDQLKKSLPFASDEEGKPLNGILLTRELGDKGQPILNMVSTDGHRLHHGVILLGEDAGGSVTGQSESRFILKKRNLQELAHVLELDAKDPNMSIEIVLNPKYVTFRWGRFYYFARLLSTPYPNYKEAFPQDFTVGVEISRESLDSALKRVSVVSDKKPEVIFDWNDRFLVLRTMNEEIGESIETIPAFVRGESGSLIFKIDFLRVLLAVTSGETIRFDVRYGKEYGAKDSMPVIWRALDDPHSRYVLMPMG